MIVTVCGFPEASKRELAQDFYATSTPSGPSAGGRSRQLERRPAAPSRHLRGSHHTVFPIDFVPPIVGAAAANSIVPVILGPRDPPTPLPFSQFLLEELWAPGPA
ncbi:hypothetical protein [Amycolatopsis sp. PS_44_ISF1]|uniref:hypothetical protein n=1 Tax=Amycolatopsis sp. PS_44_ISF1 TaxID=2974917 RepID=UPI0028DDEF77|nr:hypothetical protein [Amycolatopsis sp. PS_44_ISF1]MDT8912308.1 hypothetical protein [Amycolatopsis sp. PS_44_ISF1]